MAVVSLEKIRVFTPTAEAETLVNILQNASCLEIVTEAETAPAAETPAQLKALTVGNNYAKIEMARTFFAQYHKEKFLKVALEDGRAYTSTTELAGLAKESNVAPIIKQVEDFQFQLAEMERQEKTIIEELHTLHAWERFELPLDRITETTFTVTYALRAPERPMKITLDNIVEQVGEMVSITRVSTTTSLITLLKTSRAEVEEIISAGGVTIVKLPNTTSTAAAELERLEVDRQNIISTRASLIATIEVAAASHLPLLKKLSDVARWETERANLLASLPTTERITLVTAWAPKAYLTAIEADLSDQLSSHALEILPVAEEETIPTEISNTSLVTPFETVTKLYGAPYYKDLDPTPVLSIFFFVFFGICLSDAGYGLILMSLTGLALWNYHLEASTKQLLTLLFYGGVSTFIAGIFFGGYLGINLPVLVENYPQFQFLLDWQKFDPINNPLPVFYMALVLGFIQVVFGIFLNFYRKLSLGETKNAWLDDAPWLYFFSVAAIYVINMAGYLNDTLDQFLSSQSTVIFGSAVALIVLTQGREQKNIFAKLIFGLLGLYGSVGYFADVLSYSRLMALGLATGALAFSINSIAAFVGGDTLGIGTIFMVIVLIFGHTLNIAISLLGTFINSARLQFVEFFSKFSTGTGRAFVPFRKETRHVIILPDPPSP